jgi:hypothetical protein
MNRTAEVDLRAQRLWNADIVEHRALDVNARGGIHPVWERVPRFKEGDNETLMRAFWAGELNWTLWLKMIRRSLYVRAMEFLGEEGTTMKCSYGEDTLQMVTMYRFVRKYVTVDYFGYVHYRNVRNSAMRRTRNVNKAMAPVMALINKMAKRVITVGLSD